MHGATIKILFMYGSVGWSPAACHSDPVTISGQLMFYYLFLEEVALRRVSLRVLRFSLAVIMLLIHSHFTFTPPTFGINLAVQNK